MTELIPEVIPVRTKMSCPVDRAISQAKATMDLLATLALKRKKKARETRSRMRTMTTIVIFDEYLSRCHFKKRRKFNNRDIQSILVSLSADVNVVNIWSLFLVWGDRYWGRNCWFCYLLHFHVPLILGFFKISQSELRLSVRNRYVDSIFAKNSVNLGYHFVGVSSWILSALNHKKSTRTESRVALSSTASKEASGKSMALTSMSRYLKLSPLSLYFSFMALMQTLEMSILVMLLYPYSNIYSLSLEFPEPALRILLALSMWVVMMSLSPLYLWYQSKG